jgi:hypothetical protein
VRGSPADEASQDSTLRHQHRPLAVQIFDSERPLILFELDLELPKPLGDKSAASCIKLADDTLADVDGGLDSFAVEVVDLDGICGWVGRVLRRDREGGGVDEKEASRWCAGWRGILSDGDCVGACAVVFKLEFASDLECLSGTTLFKHEAVNSHFPGTGCQS